MDKTITQQTNDLAQWTKDNIPVPVPAPTVETPTPTVARGSADDL